MTLKGGQEGYLLSNHPTGWGPRIGFGSDLSEMAGPRCGEATGFSITTLQMDRGRSPHKQTRQTLPRPTSI